MAELFSKEYLKDLLASDSLSDAAATTAKASFETIAYKMAKSAKEGEVSSLASQVIEGTSSEAIEAATGQILSGDRTAALQTLSGGVDREALKGAASSVSSKVSQRASDRSGGLFSKEYLENLLDSDSLLSSVSQHIDGIVEEKPDIAEAVVEMPASASLAESIAVLPADESLAEVIASSPLRSSPEKPADDDSSLPHLHPSYQEMQQTTQQYSPPQQTERFENIPPPVEKPNRVQETKQKTKSRFSIGKIVFYLCLVFFILAYVVPNLTTCMAYL